MLIVGSLSCVMISSRAVMQVNYLDDGEKSLLTERDKYDLNVLSGLE